MYACHWCVWKGSRVYKYFFRLRKRENNDGAKAEWLQSGSVDTNRSRARWDVAFSVASKRLAIVATPFGLSAAQISSILLSSRLAAMATKYQNIFAALDSDEEDTPRVNKKATSTLSANVALNKPAAGNKKSGNKRVPVGDKPRSPNDGSRAPRERGDRGDRGDRVDRGGRGDRGRGHRGPRREHERRSGTGRGKESIKQGGGAHNWGNKADPNEQLVEAAFQEGAKPVSDEEAAADEVAPEEEEEEEVQLTLDEYLEKQKSSRSGDLFAEVEVRQVTNQFSSATQITKEGKTPDFIDSQYEKVYSKKTSGRKKQVITDVGFRLEKPERFTRDFDSSRGGRGGRGGRGARGNGRTGGRGGHGANVPNVTDMSAFPSLG
ncbi:unnamed protein product [Peronospora belbahrii]|uniref:Hyaluronan/mRNA-binding protein domain-containing protein n=1 Tax=Peronospora belbahrii TaxID=622444 RepID=A0ABN8CWR6_9STRA|nr:unnamed protein product [Peronospora belbahrii]